ncbi:hypothetical protein ACFO1B_03960 [Dactylosporangium siamense]|uniref:Uncharacterized protein n=1 Tax=Dactylosporangium siamense TaxID=685454 RepID=A0A919PDU4_9ACTN|nr:hypothetical protein [Dactylosporangium siamense]GIG42961.1 hypothetical protein Dsi01nite_010020 [Dactylosporangium siamense]
MTTTHTTRRVALLTTLVAAAGLLAGSPAAAQMEVTCSLTPAAVRVCASPEDVRAGRVQERFPLHEIFHADGTKVGEIYVARKPGAATYVEHWVMYPGYEYPDRIRPAAVQRFRGEQDFLDHVAFGAGYRYVRWDVVEQGTIPGRR